VQDTYLDTAAHNLRAAGYACRLRVQDDEIIVALKSLAGSGGVIHHREELEQYLSEAGVPETWPEGPVRARVLDICGAAPLLPVATLRQVRFVRLLSDGERVVAESSLDRVQMTAEGRAQTYLLFEVELVSEGQPSDLHRVVEHLRQDWLVVPEPRSKLAVALDFLNAEQVVVIPASMPDNSAQAANPGVLLDDSLPEAVRKLLLFHFQVMLRHEPDTRAGENIEALHDMRVATRRMRAVLDVFGPYIEIEPLRPFLKALRKTGRVLGQVRDLDVFSEHLQPYLGGLDSEARVDAEPLLTAWAAEHATARADMLAYLDSKAYARFTADFGAHLRAPELWRVVPFNADGMPCPYRVRHIAPLCLATALAAVLAYDEWVRGPDPSTERLHQLRIAAKRLRYTCEFLREVLDSQAARVIADVKVLQDHLGALQDAVVAQELVAAFITEGHWGAHPDVLYAPLTVPGWGGYLAERRAEQEHLTATFPEVWLRFQSRDFKRMVTELGAAL